ncbi:MAG TPA: aconitase family protein [Candidatus Limnocylindrales bacterium]|nr:aconitase family protein [Candidatus Limnocylindrales bacterium]
MPVLVNTVQAARRKAGAPLPVTAATGPPPEAATPDGRRIRGRALIFWDPKIPGKKRDAIDTDQITPAQDCVSESLDRLDERWKIGAFRHLMPDFRERVHRGETFLVAGDRFAIGSSREMSPAGLKAVAEEVGLELVVVCGADVGDIFRRNALNLGLHLIQSAQAVEDAQEGDVFSFDPSTRRLWNETRGSVYDPVPLTPKEEEIRRSGGIIAIGRREFAASVTQRPAVEWPPPSIARTLTTSQQIMWAHRVDRDAEVRPGSTIRVYCDLLPASDGTAPFAIHTFNQITGGAIIYPRQAAIANDHFVFSGRNADDRQTAIGRDFARLHEIEAPYYATPGDGIFHFYFPEQGLVVPGAFIAGADSHSRAYGAYGAVGIGVGSTQLGFGWSTGYIYVTPARARRVTFSGRLPAWVSGKDVVLALLRRWGKAQAQGMSVEFSDPQRQLPIPYRNTITNMMAEAEAQNGIFHADEVTREWYRRKGVALPYPLAEPGEAAHYEIGETLDLSALVPYIAKPFAPSNAYPADEVALEKLAFDRAFIGSCTNGGYDDLLEAALVVRSARARGFERVPKPFTVFPGSGGVKRDIERPEPRLEGESIAAVLRSVGAEIRESWCGPCFGQGPDALHKGEVAITSFNRNWQNRMGVGGLGYLASPAVVAASALLGYMAGPASLGIEWDPDRFDLTT